MLNPIFKLAKTRDEHLLIVGLLSLPGALSIDEGPADKLIAEHLALFRSLPRSVDSYPEDDHFEMIDAVAGLSFDFQDG